MTNTLLVPSAQSKGYRRGGASNPGGTNVVLFKIFDLLQNGKKSNNMRLKLSRIPQIRFLPTKEYSKYKYSLGEFSYGDFLIYKHNNPVYYLNLFDDKYKELYELISSTGNKE